MSASDVAIMAGVAALFGWGWWRSRNRARQLRHLAESSGFHYFDKTLPRPLNMSDLPEFITSVWNVLEGERRGRRVITFDCQFGVGRTRWRRTVIAVEAERSSVTVSAFDPDIQVEQIGEWTFLYHPRELALIPRQLTPVAELAAYLDAI